MPAQGGNLDLRQLEDLGPASGSHACGRRSNVAQVGHAGLATTYGTAAEGAARRDRFRAAFGKLLERAQAAGTVHRDVRVPELVALVNGAFPHLARDQAGRAAHRRLLALVLRGLAPL